MAVKRYDKNHAVLHTGEYVHKSGLYEFRYTDVYGERHSVYAPSLKELRIKEDTIEKSVKSARYTLDQAKDECFSYAELQISKKTLIQYRCTYDRYIKDKLGSRDVKTITSFEIENLYLLLHAKKKLCVNTIQSIHSVLHKILELAVKKNLITKNPASGCTSCLTLIKKREEANTETKTALSKDQRDRFLEYLLEKYRFTCESVIILLLAKTGCRIGEVAGLRAEDIDFIEKTIDINHTISYGYKNGKGDKKCGFSVTDSKTAASKRKIPCLDEMVYEFVKKLKKRNRKIRCEHIDGYKGFLFVKDNGMPYTDRNINDFLKRAVRAYNNEEADRAKLENRKPLLLPKNLTCHVFRRTVATILLCEGFQIPDIQNFLGHVDLDTTNSRYCCPDIVRAREVAKYLN